MIQLAFFQGVPDFGLSITLIIIIVVAVILIMAVSLIPMIFILRKVFGNLSQTKALLATGEPGQAKILQLWDTGVTMNDNPQVGLLLEVQTPNRPPYQVQTQCFVSRLKIPQVQVGNTVPVKIDRQDQTKIALDLP
jgi:hypothetical protein